MEVVLSETGFLPNSQIPETRLSDLSGVNNETHRCVFGFLLINDIERTIIKPNGITLLERTPKTRLFNHL
jgi:hypothetical protein